MWGRRRRFNDWSSAGPSFAGRVANADQLAQPSPSPQSGVLSIGLDASLRYWDAFSGHGLRCHLPDR